MSNTLWSGSSGDKLYLQSGQFSSTLKTSEAVGGIDTVPEDLSWDGTNTTWIGSEVDKLYLQSGQFSSTLKTSLSITGIDFRPEGVSSDGTNTPWLGRQDDKLYLQSGQFSSTLKTSLPIGTTDGSPSGISWDGTNTPWTGFASDTLYLQSGQFSSTVKTNQAVGGIDSIPQGISWDGTNTPWLGTGADKLYLQSGKFSSTLKTSLAVGGVDIHPSGIDDSDFDARVPSAEVDDINVDWTAIYDNFFEQRLFEEEFIFIIPSEEIIIIDNEPNEFIYSDHFPVALLQEGYQAENLFDDIYQSYDIQEADFNFDNRILDEGFIFSLSTEEDITIDNQPNEFLFADHYPIELLQESFQSENLFDDIFQSYDNQETDFFDNRILNEGIVSGIPTEEDITIDNQPNEFIYSDYFPVALLQEGYQAENLFDDIFQSYDIQESDFNFDIDILNEGISIVDTFADVIIIIDTDSSSIVIDQILSIDLLFEGGVEFAPIGPLGEFVDNFQDIFFSNLNPGVVGKYGKKDTFIGTYESTADTIVPVANRVYYVPIHIPFSMRVVELGVFLTLGDVLSKARFGIYNFERGTVREKIFSNETGLDTLFYASIHSSVYLSPGSYCLAFVTESSIATMRKNNITRSSLGTVTADSTANHFYEDITYSDGLPDNPGTLILSGDDSPRIIVRLG